LYVGVSEIAKRAEADLKNLVQELIETF